jgi:hypothetical protein
MPLAKELRLLEELERRPADLPLVHELGRGHAPEPRHAQLALRVVGHERLAEKDDRGPQELASLAHPEAVEGGGQLLCRRTRQSSDRLDALQDPEDLVAVDVLDRDLVGDLVLPAAPAVRPLEEERLVAFLCHLARRVPHALVGVSRRRAPLVSPPKCSNPNNARFLLALAPACAGRRVIPRSRLGGLPHIDHARL